MPTERTCVITREATSPVGLVRIVVGPDGEAGVDYRAKLKGRGAWLTVQREVVEQAEQKPAALRRALEAPLLDTAGLLDRVRAANLAAVLDFLSLCARAGVVVGGADALGRLRPEQVIAYVTASDASQASLENVARALVGVPVFQLGLDRDTLGARVGKGPRAAMAIRDAAPARALLVELRRMQALR